MRFNLNMPFHTWSEGSANFISPPNLFAPVEKSLSFYPYLQLMSLFRKEENRFEFDSPPHTHKTRKCRKSIPLASGCSSNAKWEGKGGGAELVGQCRERKLGLHAWDI